MANEAGIQLQTDTVTQVPGGPVRTIVATMPINGVPTQVQMQVVSISDMNGVILDGSYYSPQLNEVVFELQALRRLACLFMGVPFVERFREGDEQAQTYGPVAGT